MVLSVSVSTATRVWPSVILENWMPRDGLTEAGLANRGPFVNGMMDQCGAGRLAMVYQELENGAEWTAGVNARIALLLAVCLNPR